MPIGTQVTSLADLRRELQSLVREASSSTSGGNDDIADRYLNEALHDLHINPLRKAPWLVRRSTILTHAPYSTGTVSITAAARTTVTGSSTLWNTAVTGMGFNNARVGGKMTFSGITEVYEVSVVTSDTAITILNRYTGAALSAASYNYFEDEYALAADFGGPVDYRNFSNDINIALMPPMEFRRRYPRNSTTGRPAKATIIQKGFSSTTTPQYTVVFNPPPDDEYTIPYHYITTYLAVSSAGVEQTQMTATTDEPIVPLKYRHVIVLRAAWKWLTFRKGGEGSTTIKAEYVDAMQRMSNDLGIVQDKPILVFGRGQKMPTRGRFDVNEYFDKMLW